MSKITKVLTPYNFTDKNNDDRIKFIVIHYVGALGGAKGNAELFASKYIGASAHYFVGFDGEIYQSVEDEDIAWHCGAKSYIHPECRNSNSIGIELCVRKKNTKKLGATDKDWYFEDATVQAGVKLTKELMKKYNIPADHVIRHNDVTGKICPNPYVYNTLSHTWDAFKAALTGETVTTPSVEKETATVEVDNLYRVRTSWEDAESQIGAFKDINKAKAVCEEGYTVYDLLGQAVYSGGEGIKTQPYEVMITCDGLCIRPQPNTKEKEIGCINDKKHYTIVEEQNGWGLLKAYAEKKNGWIKLSYTQKVS